MVSFTGECNKNRGTNEPSRENARHTWPESCALFTAAIEGGVRSATGRKANDQAQVAVLTRDATRRSRHGNGRVRVPKFCFEHCDRALVSYHPPSLILPTDRALKLDAGKGVENPTQKHRISSPRSAYHSERVLNSKSSRIHASGVRLTSLLPKVTVWGLGGVYQLHRILVRKLLRYFHVVAIITLNASASATRLCSPFSFLALILREYPRQDDVV